MCKTLTNSLARVLRTVETCWRALARIEAKKEQAATELVVFSKLMSGQFVKAFLKTKTR